MPTARDKATNSAVCSLQSPIRVRSTSRRWQTDRRLFLKGGIHVPRQRFATRACTDDASHRLFGSGADISIIAFDERFGAQVLDEIVICRRRGERLCVENLHDVAVDALAGALQFRGRQVWALDTHAKAAYMSWVIDWRKRWRPCRNRRNNGGGMNHVLANTPVDDERPRALRRLAHRDEAERTFLANDLTRLGNPCGRLQTGEFHFDAKSRYRCIDRTHNLALANLDRDARIPQRRGVEHIPAMQHASPESFVREPAHEVQ
jgi:hypothetical protein